MRFLLVLLTTSVLSATPIVRGTYSSSNADVACVGGSVHPQADCIVEYASNALMPVSEFAFILQASAGNRSSTTTDELAVLDFSGGGVTTPGGGDLAWVNGTSYNFSATYNAATRALVYTVNGVAINVTISNAMLINDLFLRTQAETTGGTMKISDLVVDGVSLGAEQSLANQSIPAAQVYYLWISGLNNSFTVTGKLTMTWPTGSGTTPPSNTDIVAYMKFGRATNAPPLSPPVPEPASFAMCGLGLVVLGLFRRPTKRT